MKIGYLMQSDPVDLSKPSGPAMHVRSVITQWQEQGHEVRVVIDRNQQVYYSDDLDSWISAEKHTRTLFQHAIQSVQSRLKLPFFRYFDSRRYAHACCQLLADCDVLYERYSLLSYGGVIAAQRLGVPILVEFNGDPISEYEQVGLQLSRQQWAVIHALTRLYLRRYATIVTVDQALHDMVIQRWKPPASEVKVVPNGANYHLFSQQFDTKDVLNQYDLHDGFVITYVGGFHPWQGVDQLISAIPHIAEYIPHFLILLIGDSDHRMDIETQVNDGNWQQFVRFVGHQPAKEVSRLLSISDIAIAPYRNWRPLTGLKVYEYMAAGRPILTTGYNNTHPVLEHLKTAYLLDEVTPTTIATALIELYSQPKLRNLMAANAQKLCRDNFTWAQTASALESLCQEAINNG